MAVTKVALSIATWLSAALALFGLAVFALGTIESLYTLLFKQGGSYYQFSAWVDGWAKWLAFPVLAYLAKNDLNSLPPHVTERFQFKHLGWLGWLALFMFAASLFSFFEITVWLRWSKFVWLGPLEAIYQILHLMHDVMLYFWLGSLCLYARYRTAALKRVAAESQV